MAYLIKNAQAVFSPTAADATDSSGGHRRSAVKGLAITSCVVAGSRPSTTSSSLVSGHRTYTIIITTSTKEKKISTILMSTLSIQIAAREADAKAKVAAAKKKAPKAKKETK